MEKLEKEKMDKKEMKKDVLYVNMLRDMDWRFGVSLSNSELNEVGKTYLQVKFAVDNGKEIENVFLEMTIDQFYAFIKNMEEAKAALDVYSK